MFDYFSTRAGLFSNEVQTLLNEEFIFIANWKWIILFLTIVLGNVGRPYLEIVLQHFKNKLLKNKTEEKFGYHFLKLPIEKPTVWLVYLASILILADIVEFPTNFQKYLFLICKVAFSYFSIILAYLAVDALGVVIHKMASATDNRVDDQLAPFAKKSLKVVVVIVGGLVILQNIGINVTSLLAGLGIGGLALALAAQDTAANLFGSITIIFDSPFKIGDWIKVGDIEGTIEDVGFRSTRIRTFYNSLITVPNSIMAKEKIDNMGVRPKRRIRQNIGINYNTPPEKIEQFCDNIKYAIIQIPQVDKESISVYFNNYLDSSLNIQVIFHITAETGPEELKIQQNFFCDLLTIAKNLGIEFAFPTQTVYYISDRKEFPFRENQRNP